MYDSLLNVDTLSSSRDGGVHDYDYDGLDHLTQATRPAGFGVADEAYSYDEVGNRLTQNGSSTFTYENNHRITQSPGLTYGYDADGNQTSRSDGTVMGFDYDNQLTSYSKSPQSATYHYDAFGRRVKKVVNGTTTWFVWDGSQLLAEYDGTGNRSKRYAYLPNSLNPVQVEDANGIYSVHQDHLDTPRFLTNAAQQVVWSAKQSAFGQMTIAADPDGDGKAVGFNVRFPGQYFDGESGLHYNYFRVYDPVVGRYITADPIGLNGGINVYLYADAAPSAYYDPLGLITNTIVEKIKPGAGDVTCFAVDISDYDYNLRRRGLFQDLQSALRELDAGCDSQRKLCEEQNDCDPQARVACYRRVGDACESKRDSIYANYRRAMEALESEALRLSKIICSILSPSLE